MPLIIKRKLIQQKRKCRDIDIPDREVESGSRWLEQVFEMDYSLVIDIMSDMVERTIKKLGKSGCFVRKKMAVIARAMQKISVTAQG